MSITLQQVHNYSRKGFSKARAMHNYREAMRKLVESNFGEKMTIDVAIAKKQIETILNENIRLSKENNMLVDEVAKQSNRYHTFLKLMVKMADINFPEREKLLINAIYLEQNLISKE